MTKRKKLDPYTLRWAARLARGEERWYRALALKFKRGTVGREANVARGDAASILAQEFVCEARDAERENRRR
jgi:hypothetical protein